MKYSGKRTDRFWIKQIGMDPELGDVIRSSRNGLTCDVRILELVEKGLDYEAIYGRNGNGFTSLHMSAHVGTLLPAGALQGTENSVSGAEPKSVGVRNRQEKMG